MGIKVYRSDDASAPVLTGMAGTLINVLDACLVNGYGTRTVTSMTRVDNVVTVTFSTEHKFRSFDWVSFNGADQAEYNKEFQITYVDAYTLTFLTDDTPVSPATGTVTAKRAPAGFGKPFAGTGKAVYRSQSLASRRHYLRVVDDGSSSLGTRVARLRAYEEMTGVDAGTNPFPALHQISGDGFTWNKSNEVSTTERQWIIVSDGKTFYMQINGQQTKTTFVDDTYAQVNGFGDLSTFAPDAYSTFLSGGMNADPMSDNNTLMRPAGDSSPSPSSMNSSVAIARHFSGVTGSVYGVGLLGHCFSGTNALGASALLPYPHTNNNRFFIAPVMVYMPGGYMHAQLPGCYESLHGHTHTQGKLLEGMNPVGLEGRRFMSLTGRSHNSGWLGMFVVDLTGPWEIS